MAKFNFSNFKESLNGLTKRAKNIKINRSDSSRYSKGKRSASSDQSLGWRIAKYGFIGLLTFFVICVIAGGGLFAYYVSSVPKLTENKLQSTNSSKIYDTNGSLIADLGSEKRESASTDEIPTTLVNAITSIEDKRFFTHRGIDVYRIMGAAVNNLRHSSTQGGSTLDQQLIKLAYFSTNTSDQTLKRKSQEIWLSLQMERQFTKQEILTFYVHKVYMGNGYYGMKTAAKSYFGKDLSDLSVAQAALLVFHRLRHNTIRMLILMQQQNVVILFLKKCMTIKTFLKTSMRRQRQQVYQMAFSHLRKKLAMNLI